MNASEIKVGDSVFVHNYNRSAIEAKVVKVGRTLVYIEVYGRSEPFRLDTQQTNGRYSYVWFRTPAQEVVAEEKAAMESDIRAAGLEFRMGCRPTDEQILELAELVRRWKS